MNEPQVLIKDFSVSYRTKSGILQAVGNVTLEIGYHESLGIVGESGCGKSTLGVSMLRLLPPNATCKGSILFKGDDLLSLHPDQMRKLRGSEISMIFQDPMTSLNPIMRIRDHFFELFRVHNPGMQKGEMIEIAKEALHSVGVDPSRLDNYPFEFSGGMRQRVMIAISIALKPALLVADEPTTSLDVVVQEQIMQLLKKLKSERNMSIMLITHDMGIVAELAEKVAVMYAGRLVEYAPVRQLYTEPLHPYTRLLLRSIPNIKLDDMDLKYIPGSLPDLKNPPQGCRFYPRCPFSRGVCKDREPPDIRLDDNRRVKCWLYGDG